MKKLLKKQRPEKKSGNKPRSWRQTLLLGGFVCFLALVVIGFIGATLIYFKFSKGLPDVRLLKTYQPSTITRLYSDTDELIAEFYIEKRIMVPLENIPLKLKQATLAVEDSNFYYHFGIDPKAIFRALITNLKAGHVVEGGSTITQQLSKTLFLSRERTLERKIREAILAIRMELIFTKDEILEMYLNQIYYGHGAYGVEAAARTYFGKTVQDLTTEECAMIASLPKAPTNYSPYTHPERAKSRRNHAIRRMAHLGFISQGEAQQAMKTGFELGEISEMLNRAPYFVEYIRRFLEDTYGTNKLYRGGLKVYTTLNIDYQDVAQRSLRENLRIIDKRFGYRGPLGRIDVSQDRQSLQEELLQVNEFELEEAASPEEDPFLKEGDFLKGAVVEVSSDKAQVLLGLGSGVIELADMDWARRPNPKVDGRWARIRSVRHALAPGDLIRVRVLGPQQENGQWPLALEQEPEVQAGLITLEPGTGHIKSMVGGYDFSKSQFNRAVQAVRQPGSAFKPIIYSAAIQEGFSPASIIIDSPIIFKEKEEAFDKWKPVNFEEKFYGPTTLRTALTHSRNVVTIKLLQKIGVHKAIQMSRNLGIDSHLADNLSIALGSSGVTLLELTSAYSTFANMGERVSPLAIRYIKNRKGEIVYSAQPGISRPISSGLANIITSLLQSVVEHGTGKKVKVLGRPIAGKTGTTNNFIDAWFIGYTPELVTGVWVGKDADAPMGINETGSRAAIPIWLQYMQEILMGVPLHNFPVSDEVYFTKIIPKTGKAADFNDPKGQFEIFLVGQEPETDSNILDPLAENTF